MSGRVWDQPAPCSGRAGVNKGKPAGTEEHTSAVGPGSSMSLEYLTGRAWRTGGVVWKMYHRSWSSQLHENNVKWDKEKPWETYPTK